MINVSGGMGDLTLVLRHLAWRDCKVSPTDRLWKAGAVQSIRAAHYTTICCCRWQDGTDQPIIIPLDNQRATDGSIPNRCRIERNRNDV